MNISQYVYWLLGSYQLATNDQEALGSQVLKIAEPPVAWGPKLLCSGKPFQAHTRISQVRNLLLLCYATLTSRFTS